MTRQYPEELHIGQKVYVRFDPTAHPIAALVTAVDTSRGVVQVNPIGYKIRWATRPRAISNEEGHFLHFDDQHFFFAPTRPIN
jgi:hypothetical protein